MSALALTLPPVGFSVGQETKQSQQLETGKKDTGKPAVDSVGTILRCSLTISVPHWSQISRCFLIAISLPLCTGHHM